MNILIVEDDESVGRSLEKGLREGGYNCEWIRRGGLAVERAQTQKFDVILLDLLLPEVPGLEILRRIRAAGLRTPVLVLSALGAVGERVEGLQAGADDYIVKPFAFAELLARIQTVWRRSAPPPPTLEVGPLSLDLTARRVRWEGKDVALTPTEFSLLELLMRNAGQVVTRRMVCEHLWSADWEGETNILEVHVTRLRAKLDRVGAVGVVETVRGRGYAIRAR